jgi:hypothetical protein
MCDILDFLIDLDIFSPCEHNCQLLKKKACEHDLCWLTIGNLCNVVQNSLFAWWLWCANVLQIQDGLLPISVSNIRSCKGNCEELSRVPAAHLIWHTPSVSCNPLLRGTYPCDHLPSFDVKLEILKVLETLRFQRL